jgi:hypothetical protein
VITALIDASKEVGLGVNIQKSSFTSMSMILDQNVGPNHNMKTVYRSFEKLKYLGMRVTNEDLIREVI